MDKRTREEQEVRNEQEMSEKNERHPTAYHFLTTGINVSLKTDKETDELFDSLSKDIEQRAEQINKADRCLLTNDNSEAMTKLIDATWSINELTELIMAIVNVVFKRQNELKKTISSLVDASLEKDAERERKIVEIQKEIQAEKEKNQNYEDHKKVIEWIDRYLKHEPKSKD